MPDTPLWTPRPERIAGSHLSAFSRLMASVTGESYPDYASLWQASIELPETFWSLLWDYGKVIGDKGKMILQHGDSMQKARFFPEAQLNYAENLLRRDDEAIACVFWSEDKIKRQLSWRELNEMVSRLQQAMRAMGIQAGDRVAGFVTNQPETLAAMLAAVSLGAIWTSCSTDFGLEGCLDRFGQTEPKLLFCPDGCWYNGKAIDLLPRVAAISAALACVERVVVLPYLAAGASFASQIPKAETLDAFIAAYPARSISYTRVPFRHPLFILYSSGTTGKPKCIVHGHGGTLLQHIKEHQLHADIHAGDTLFYFTTCGWMMWNWLASGLASGATLLCYDGSPFASHGRVLWDYADQQRCTHFGTSAKYLDGLRKLELKPAEHWHLDSLRAVFSTGSALAAESFDWVYRHIKRDINLASISGGTDIVSCFALGNPNLPVWAGELQCCGLGMAVDVVNEAGQPLRGEKGELVCRQPFPSMPIGFWRDPDGSLYRKAYFARFAGIWSHGDYAEITAHDGLIIYGRSDAVLNPGGVRIGTAEIYRQVEAIPAVIESLAVGQRWQGDERVILFVRLQTGAQLDSVLMAAIKNKIREGASPRHVPALIIAVADIPRTLSGKIVELAVKNVIHGEAVSNLTALANPEALTLFRDLPELAL